MTNHIKTFIECCLTFAEFFILIGTKTPIITGYEINVKYMCRYTFCLQLFVLIEFKNIEDTGLLSDDSHTFDRDLISLVL